MAGPWLLSTPAPFSGLRILWITWKKEIMFLPTQGTKHKAAHFLTPFLWVPCCPCGIWQQEGQLKTPRSCCLLTAGNKALCPQSGSLASSENIHKAFSRLVDLLIIKPQRWQNMLKQCQMHLLNGTCPASVMTCSTLYCHGALDVCISLWDRSFEKEMF